MRLFLRITCFVCVFCLGLSVLGEIRPVAAAEENNFAFEDTSDMTDEEFFGIWDFDKQEWSVEGKINYNYSEDLSEVERYAKLGGYSMAKRELLEYYKNRSGIKQPAKYSGSTKSFRFLTMYDTYNFTENYISTFNVDSTEYKRYEVDIGTTTASGVFMLAALEKEGDIVSVASREAGSELAPKLVLYYSTNTVKTVEVSADSYIRAYDDTENYQNENYGAEPEVLVKGSYYQRSNGTYSPFSSRTREGYIAFPGSQISTTDLVTAKLIFYAKLIPEEAGTETSNTNKEIVVYDAYNKSWRERESDSGTYPLLTWAGISHNHYSWTGVPGGFDWLKPEGASSEYINYNSRFTQQPALLIAYERTGDEAYINKAIEITLDFINDAGAGFPVGRDIEAANRMLEIVPVYFSFLAYENMNAEASTAILKYMWEEAEFLYSGNYYQNYNNRGLWHTTAFFSLIKYMPEFKEVDKWAPVMLDRLDYILDALIADDGAYVEATFSYPGMIVNFLKRILQGYDDTNYGYHDVGLETIILEKVNKKIVDLAKYLMYVSYPSRYTPNFGEGGVARSVGTAQSVLDVIDDDELRFIATNGQGGSAPQNFFKLFENKMLTTRTSWDDDAYMLFMNAKNGGTHNHKDSLALLLYAKDREVLSDTGMTTYDSKHPHFQWQRHRSSSHNTIEIDYTQQRGDTGGLDLSGDSDIQIYPGEKADYIEAWTDASLGFRHYRDVVFLKNLKFVIVSDMVAPEEDDNKTHTYTQNWHTRPLANNVMGNTGIGNTNFSQGSNIRIIQADMTGIEPALETGYDSEGQSTTKYFSYKQVAAGSIAYQTVLLPIEEGNEIVADVTKIDTGTQNHVSSALKLIFVKNDDTKKSVVHYNSFEETPSARSFDNFETDAKMFTLVYDEDDNVSTILIKNGTYLNKNGKALISANEAIPYAEISFTDKGIEINNESQADSKLVISSEQAPKNVFINGTTAKYTFVNNTVHINQDLAEITAEDGLKFGGIVKVGNEEYNISLEFEKGTKVSGGELTIPEFSESNGKISVSTPEITTDKAVKLSVSVGRGSSALLNGTAISSVSLMTKDTANSQLVSGGNAISVTSRDNIVIWTKTLGTFLITPPKPAGSDVTVGGGAPSPIILGSSNKSGETNIETGSPESGKSETTEEIAFDDISGHWAEQDIYFMAEKDYIKGVSKNLFDPDRSITKAEFAAILMRIWGDVEFSDADNIFEDVKDDDWFFESVMKAVKLNIVSGYDGMFYPNDYITREEMSAIAVRAYEKRHGSADEQNVSFSDSAEISIWADAYIGKAVGLGLISGMSDGTFAPSENSSRAQAAAVLRRLFNIF